MLISFKMSVSLPLWARASDKAICSGGAGATRSCSVCRLWTGSPSRSSCHDYRTCRTPPDTTAATVFFPSTSKPQLGPTYSFSLFRRLQLVHATTAPPSRRAVWTSICPPSSVFRKACGWPPTTRTRRESGCSHPGRAAISFESEMPLPTGSHRHVSSLARPLDSLSVVGASFGSPLASRFPS